MAYIPNYVKEEKEVSMKMSKKYNSTREIKK
jgi:hypothetical protein